MKTGYCASCGCTHEIKSSFSGKLMAAGVLSTLAPKLARNPLIALLVSVGSLAVGHLVDKEIEKTCPSCGVAFQLLSNI